MSEERDLTRVTARCGGGKHGWCEGRVYVFDPGSQYARLGDCECGCGCSPRVPVSRAGAARTRRRQLEKRAAANASRREAADAARARSGL